jgi:hypothetical protein
VVSSYRRFRRPTQRSLQDPSSEDVLASAQRRPAMPPMFCRHRHVFANCRICSSEWYALYGHVVPRL